MQIKAHQCFQNQGVANHLNVFERSSTKRTRNHSLGLVPLMVLDDITENCAPEIQMKVRKQRAGRWTALLRSVSMRGESLSAPSEMATSLKEGS